MALRVASGMWLTNGAATYSYGQQNRFTQYQQGNITETYRHNGQGQRTSKTTSQRTLTSDGAATTNQSIYLVYDEQGQLIGEYTEAGRRIREYIYLDSTPIATIDQAGNLAYIETDHLQTPRALIDPARNQAIWTWDSLATAFGEHKPQQDPDRDGIQTVFNLRFPSQYFDETTKLHQNGFRPYDPSIGRYTQSDPIGLKGGINTYLYANANSLSYSDPSGLNPGVGCLAGSLAGPPGCVVGAGIGTVVMGGIALGMILSTPGDTPKTNTCVTDSGDKDPCKGLRDQLRDHERKLREYMANPIVTDNKGFLAGALAKNDLDLYNKIYLGRIASLQSQIANFKKLLQECERRNGR